MKLLRTIWLVGFLGLMGLAAQQVSQASAMQPPRFTLTDLGYAEGHRNLLDGTQPESDTYTPPTGYKIGDIYSSDPSKPGYRIGWTFTKDGSTRNLLPDYMDNSYVPEGYSSSGTVFGHDSNTASAFYFNTSTNELGYFKETNNNDAAFISSINSSGQALGFKITSYYEERIHDNACYFTATYYNSLTSDPVLLKDLINTTLGDWLLGDGPKVNDNGQIFGTMFNPKTSQINYYRLDPVQIPEPSTILILTAGALICFVQNLSRKNRRI